MYGSVGTGMLFAKNRSESRVSVMVHSGGFQGGSHRGDLYTCKLTGIVAKKKIGRRRGGQGGWGHEIFRGG